jgi:hypothetical protein
MRRQKQYIIKKYVMAFNVQDALRKEKSIRADEAWIDEEWRKENPTISHPIGFKENKKYGKTN